MRVTIIRDDGVVGVGGVFRQVDLSALFEGVRVVQWDGTQGHVEYDDTANTLLGDIDPFQPFIDLWIAAAPQPPAPPTTAQMISAALARINGDYQSAVKVVTADYPEEEVKSWPKQEEEARAWELNNDMPTPWIDGAVIGRGITKAAFVAKILAKAALFSPIHGELTGKAQGLRDQIEALGVTPTQQQLDAIQW
ncbi:hypothetical protein [Nitrosospira sp. NpAV]|uniref:hypothetical protein n=1 Tax=Nitrosospira sp. NpAV TaxID=58133 RepID=UPI000695C4DD|nr:hypothetical protein [Nitrosospira sp. NpAV]